MSVSEEIKWWNECVCVCVCVREREREREKVVSLSEYDECRKEHEHLIDQRWIEIEKIQSNIQGMNRQSYDYCYTGPQHQTHHFIVRWCQSTDRALVIVVAQNSPAPNVFRQDLPTVAGHSSRTGHHWSAASRQRQKRLSSKELLS